MGEYLPMCGVPSFIFLVRLAAHVSNGCKS